MLAPSKGLKAESAEEVQWARTVGSLPQVWFSVVGGALDALQGPIQLLPSRLRHDLPHIRQQRLHARKPRTQLPLHPGILQGLRHLILHDRKCRCCSSTAWEQRRCAGALRLAPVS